MMFEDLIEKLLHESRDKNRAFDLDDTCIDFSRFFVQSLNAQFGTALSHEQVVSYDTSKILPLKEKGATLHTVGAVVRAMGNSAAFMQLKVRPYFYPVMSYFTDGMQKIGYERNFLLTSRSTDFYDNPLEKTLSYVAKHSLSIPAQNVLLTRQKVEKALEKNVAVAFEDNLEIALAYAQEKIPVFLFRQPWNDITHYDTELLSTEDLHAKEQLVAKAARYTGEYVFRVENWKILSDIIYTRLVH